ncbi:MAG: PLP-dependent aminotransferase family protein [Cellulomonas sp.]|uniref:MocR-like transcription factor YczR n=1 Tax=Cellulomonas sp. TaxID=40001 RepID=UPI00258439B8|nr:PLP-dependent aminotransferase family protein [Cellulomonas sp.]MCR6703695.1 PLP-dependent aminotransferase family protein [Cellulomonas sp.]
MTSTATRAEPPLTSDRRVSGHGVRSIIGSWSRPGAAYGALADALRQAVLSGALPLRTRLPSERELAEALGVSRTTTTAAYDTLRDEGYLTSRRGSGTVTTLPTRLPSTTGQFRAAQGADDLVDLTTAAPFAPDELHAAVRDALDLLPRYLPTTGYFPGGLPELRAAIAARYTERGTPTTPDQVLVTTGGQEAIHLLVGAHAGPGDRVLLEHPTYPHAIDAVRAASARPVVVPSGPDGIDLDLFASTLRQASPRLAYLIPDHRNPTGTSLSADARAQVRELADRTRTLVVGDEALTDLTLEGPDPASFAGDATSPHVACLGSASKGYWGGLRIGWVRGHRDLVGRLTVHRGHVDIGSSVLDQLVVARLLADRDAVLARRRQQLRERRDLVRALIAQRLPSWTPNRPAGGLSLWVDLGAPVSSALAALAPRHGVRVAAGPAFGVEPGLERYLRVPFTEPPDRLELAVDGLARAWAELGVDDDVRASSPTGSLVVV